MKKWLIIGILIRIAVSAITYHPDTHFFILFNYLIGIKQLWLSFYDFLGTTPNPLAQILPPYAVTYPPLVFLVNGTFALFSYFLLDKNFLSEFIVNPNSKLGNPHLFLTLLITKLPYLLADLSTGYFLSQLFSKNQRLETFKLWMLNPVTLYASFAIGQFDIYPTLMMVMTLWFVEKQQPKHAALMLGIGGAFKMFPLLLPPFLILREGRSLKQRVILAIIGLAGYIGPIIPYLSSLGFRTYALLSQQTEKMLFAKISITGAEYISVFVVFYFIWLAISHSRKLDLWVGFLGVLLIFLSVTHYHPQWVLWCTPLIIVAHQRFLNVKWLILALGFCYLFIVLSFESSLNYGLVVPLVPNLRNAANLSSYFPTQIDFNMYKSIVRSIFAALSLWLLLIVSTHKIQKVK